MVSIGLVYLTESSDFEALKRRRYFLKKKNDFAYYDLGKINGLSNTTRKKPVNYFLSLFFTRNEIPMCLSRLLLLKTMMICSVFGAGRSRHASSTGKFWSFCFINYLSLFPQCAISVALLMAEHFLKFIFFLKCNGIT